MGLNFQAARRRAGQLADAGYKLQGFKPGKGSFNAFGRHGDPVILQYESTGETKQIKGAELMENLRLEIPEKQSSDLITYRTKT